ncbi:MAG: ribonuclease P protein component [Acidobacteria bacterium]|nr:ribonuclease P protein component [Acidobacteriota bacterium]
MPSDLSVEWDDDCRLLVQHRLQRRSDFQEIYKNGRSLETRFFVLYYRQNAYSCHRLGITASRKIGSAVTRNRVKRLFREIFRRNRPLGPVFLDIVINARKIAASATYSDLEHVYRAAVVQIIRKIPPS